MSATWVIDFEFIPVGGRPRPLCMVATNIDTKAQIVRWGSALTEGGAPFEILSSTTLVAYYAPAELACFQELGWPTSCRVIDLWIEFRNLRNGDPDQRGWSLVDACRAFGVNAWSATQKHAMRDLILSRETYSDAERSRIITYCRADVEATVELHRRMLPTLDVPKALLRGEYMKVVAAIEREGVPIDGKLHADYAEARQQIRLRVTEELAGRSRVFIDGRFSTGRFERFITDRALAWPRDDLSRPRLDRHTFERMRPSHADVDGVLEARRLLAQTRRTKLEVDADGRARAQMRPFGSRTGRNQPSPSKFIFGMPEWMRGFVAPPPGYALIEIDYAQEEFGIAAALSRDEAMIAAYNDPGCPYVAFAQMAGAVPADATAESHPKERALFKRCALSALYDVTPDGLAAKLRIPLGLARRLVAHHHRVFPQYWRWSDAAVLVARLHGHIESVFGWRMIVGAHTKDRSIRNFPIQAAGAEILRVACIGLAAQALTIVATSHDAIVVLVPIESARRDALRARDVMERASALVLGEPRFTLKTTENVVAFPNRWRPESPIWPLVIGYLTKDERC